MGHLKVDPNTAADFTVKLRQPGGAAGARDVTSIVLNPSGNSNYSNLLDSVITELVDGDVYVEEDDGFGGVLSLTAPGGVDGDVTARAAQNVIIGGLVHGNVDIDYVLEGFTLDIFQVSPGNEITIVAMDNDSTFRYGAELGEYAGITIGLLGNAVTIELGYWDVEPIPAIDGAVFIGSDLTAGSTLDVIGELNESTLTIDGNVVGTIIFSGRDSYPARLQINGSITSSGSITALLSMDTSTDVVGDLEGDVTCSGNLYGDFTIGGTLKGDIHVENVAGAIRCDKLGTNGRILIDGLLYNAITIDKGTNANSLIQIIDGLHEFGSITINSSEGHHSAGGDIFIGDPDTYCLTCELVTVYFDGNICVKDHDPSGEDGDLNGDITVVGCHVTDDDLEICIDGAINGNITIEQTDCTEQVANSCTGCP